MGIKEIINLLDCTLSFISVFLLNNTLLLALYHSGSKEWSLQRRKSGFYIINEIIIPGEFPQLIRGIDISISCYYLKSNMVIHAVLQRYRK